MHLAYSIAVVIALSIAALPASAACMYLLVLTCLSARSKSPPASSREMFFDVIVPAHDEAAGIGKTISSLKRLSWPSARYRIIVVADNCTDATATIAREA